MDSLFVSHQPLLSFLFSFLPPSSSTSSLCSSANRATPALLPTSPLSSSSLLHVYTLKGSTEPTGPTPNTHTQTHSFSHCPSFFHSCQQNSTAAHFLLFFVFPVFDTKHFSFCLFLSLSRLLLLLLLLSSSCQVDISFISQEVFDRPFYEEMYPPAAPIATAQLQYIFPPMTDFHRRFNFHPFFSLHHSGPFHFTFLFLNKNILQCLEQHLEERPSLYFVSSHL